MTDQFQLSLFKFICLFVRVFFLFACLRDTLCVNACACVSLCLRVCFSVCACMHVCTCVLSVFCMHAYVCVFNSVSFFSPTICFSFYRFVGQYFSLSTLLICNSFVYVFLSLSLSLRYFLFLQDISLFVLSVSLFFPC